MSISNTTQMANREGQEIRIYDYETYEKGGDSNTPIMTIDYANSVAWDLNADAVWATGGKYKSKKVKFDNSYEGTATISTQLITPEITALVAGQKITSEPITNVKFTNKRNTKTPYYVIEADTLRKDKDNNLYAEDMIAYKASVNKKFSRTYEGEGDPQASELVFDLGCDEDDDVLEVVYADISDEDETP